MADTRAINFADPVNRGHALNRGRVAWWLTLPGSVGGGTWRDITNNKNTGVLTNMATGANGFRPTNRPGGYGQILCDGASTFGYVDCGSAAAWNQTNWTVSAWFIRTGNSPINYNGIASRAPNASTAGQFFLYHLSTDNKLHVDIPYVVADAVKGTTVLSALGVWNHAAVTKVENFYSLYLNGILDGTATTANAPTFSGSFKIANYYDTGNHGLVGSVDDVQFYSRGCSAVEILQIYNLSQRGYPGVLNRLHWPMTFAAAAGGGNHFRRTNQFAKRTGCRQST